MRIKEETGLTLFVSIIVMGTLFLVATGLANLAVKQSLVSSSGQDSQHAFYAADSGMECATYWDVKNPSGTSAFATSSSSVISCNGQDFTVGGNGFGAPTPFTLLLTPDPFCAEVTVTKNADGTTLVESLGRNNCDAANNRKVERAVRATY